MTDTQLANYIIDIMSINNFRESKTWFLSTDPRLGYSDQVYTAAAGDSSIFTQITYAIKLLRTWINNPAAAQAYLTAEETSHLRLMIANHFLQYGVPGE